jgi:hypothetical protein
MDGFFCADLGEMRPVWKNFGQLGRYATKIDGGNSTVQRVRPFLNELLCMFDDIYQNNRCYSTTADDVHLI